MSNIKTVTRYAPDTEAQEARATRMGLTRQTREMRFTVICLCIGLFGCRFGMAIGSSHLSFVAPAILAFAIVALIGGHLSLHKARLALFVLLCALTVISMSTQVINPDRFAVGFSILSLGQFLLLTSLAILSFTQHVDEMIFYKNINKIFALIAILGIIQFIIQFVGVYLFSFKDFLPANLTYETGFHLEIPIGDTKYFKSNGLFLLEPSMFSQFMALGLCIEILIMRRFQYLILLLVALIVSVSGTGWIMLGSFIAAVAFGMRTRGLVLALAMIGLLGGAMVALAVIAPDIFELFWGRVGEFGAPGSSGHDRFVAPFWVLWDVVSRAPWALWAGIGAGAGGRLSNITYEFSQNTPVKLVIEFGLPVMLTYTALLMTGTKTRLQMILLVPAMVMLYLTGETAQLPPVLYPVLLIVCIPKLSASNSSRTNEQDQRSWRQPLPSTAIPNRRLQDRASITTGMNQ